MDLHSRSPYIDPDAPARAVVVLALARGLASAVIFGIVIALSDGSSLTVVIGKAAVFGVIMSAFSAALFLHQRRRAQQRRAGVS